MYDKNIILEVLIMPRYKLSPAERALEQERKENLRNIMKGLDVKNFDDLKDVFKMMVREMLENCRFTIDVLHSEIFCYELNS